ncbi:MAG: HEPN domain-containing protein [Longimicrobiales bacterium]|nr:HEPN domain-containing protein [Longimicrobiales bacterium]
MKPPEEVRLDFVREWLEKAGRDLAAGGHLLTGEGGFPETVAFHAQQAAEKYLKAFLVWHQVEFPKTHDVARLLELIAPLAPDLATALEEADSLTPYGVDYRYPGDYPEVSSAEAKRCIDTAMAVRGAILTRLPTNVIE